MDTNVADPLPPEARAAPPPPAPPAQPSTATTRKVWAGTTGAGAGTLLVQLAVAVLNQYVLPDGMKITEEISGLLTALVSALAAHQLAYRTAPSPEEAVVVREDGTALSARRAAA